MRSFTLKILTREERRRNKNVRVFWKFTHAGEVGLGGGDIKKKRGE